VSYRVRIGQIQGESAIGLFWTIGAVLLVGFVAFLVGTKFGYRLTLAKQRVGDLRLLISQYTASDSLQQAFHRSLVRREQLETLNKPQHVRIVNATQFVLLMNWDVVALAGLISKTRPGWDQKLHARVLALTIYESVIKLEQFFDPEWTRRWSPRQALGKLGISGYDAQLDGLHLRLKAFQQAHGSVMEGIRKNIIGHRDQDVGQQMEWLRKADVPAIQSAATDLINWSSDAIAVLSTILDDVWPSEPPRGRAVP